MGRKASITVFALATALFSANGGARADGYKKMSDEDFFLDRKDLIGQQVEVASDFQAEGDIIFMLLPDESNATFINVDKVAREDRKTLHARCQDKCKGSVQGVVKLITSPFGPDVGIVADTLKVDQ